MVLAAAMAFCAYLFVWTLGTQPTIGDEARHFRRAVNYFEAPLPYYRVAYDPDYPAGQPGAIPYYDTSLWHEILALGWKAFGHVSFTLAQVYHLVFFFGLIVFTYLVGRELFGERGGLWSAGLVATCPINLFLGMAFYREIPMLALLAAALYFLICRRPVLVGMALGGAYLMKGATAAAMMPPLFLIVFLQIGSTWRQRVLRTLLMAAVALAAILPDTYWRVRHFQAPIMFRYYAPTPYPPVLAHLYAQHPSPPVSAIPWSIFDPWLVAQLLGPTGLLVLGFGSVLGVYLLLKRVMAGASGWRAGGWAAAAAALTAKEAAPVWLLAPPIVAYTAIFATLLPGAYDVRYLQPITLFAGLLAGGLLGSRKILAYEGRRKALVRGAGWLLVAAMVGQALAVPWVVHDRRRLSPEVEAAMQWIQANVPQHARILYLEENLTAITARPIVWAATAPHLFFEADERQQVQILKCLGVSYIAVHPTRRCDAVVPGTVPTAYPRTWLRTLPGRPYLERVYPMGDVGDTEGRFLLYRIDYAKVPPDWLTSPDLKQAGAC